jgi:hypothetical protein
MNLDQLPNPNYDLPSTTDDRPQLALRGYKVNKRTLQADDTLSLTLHWQTLEQPKHNYLLAFFLANETGNPVGVPAYQWPALEPIGGEWPTSQWPTDYWVQDRVDLPLGADIPEGRFTLWGIWVEAGSEPLVKIEMNSTQIELGSINIASGQ